MRLLLALCLSLFACTPPAPNVGQLCAMGAAGRPAAPTAIVTGKKLKSLTLTTDALVYIDRAGTGSVRKANLDGTGDTALYGPPAQGRSVFDALVVGTTVYFTEQEQPVLGSPVNRLFTVPLAGGTPTSVVMTEASLFFLGHSAADSSLTMKSANSGSSMSAVYRVNPADGAQTLLIGPKNVENAHLTADALYFMYRPDIGNDASSRALHRAPREAAATDAQVGTTFCRSSFWVTATGTILCSGYSSTGTGSPSSATMTKLTLMGEGAATFVDLKPDFGGSFSSVAAEVGDEVVLTLGGTGDTYPVLAANVSTGAVRAVACDAAPAEQDTGTSRAEAASTADAFFWIGEGATTSADNTLWRAALR